MFSGQSEKQYGRPGLWLAETFSTSPLKPLNGIQRNLTGSKILMSSTKFVFFRTNRKTRWSPGLWLAEIFLTSPLKPLNRIQQNLTGSKILTSSTKFVFFGLIGKTKWPPWPLIGWDIFDFSSVGWLLVVLRINVDLAIFQPYLDLEAGDNQSLKIQVARLGIEPWSSCSASQEALPLGHRCSDFSPETAKRNSTKLDRKQDLNVLELYQVCVFQADRKKRWLPWPLIGWYIFDFSSETAERNSTKLDRK